VKIIYSSLAALGVVSLAACTVSPSPMAPTATVTADASLLAGIETQFYRAFVQNGYESPDHLEPIRLLQRPLRVYLRTVDNARGAIDTETLDLTERILNQSAWIWSGDTFGVIEVVRGAGTQEKIPGWITVKWSNASSGGACGHSTVGVDGGFIEFNASGDCSCGTAARIYPRLIRHELGHAMGYYHTDDAADVMYGRPISSDACDVMPSDRERRHAKFAHQLP
jgi:hypothetical protein